MFRFKLIIFLILFFISFRSFGGFGVKYNIFSPFIYLFGESKKNVVSKSDTDAWELIEPNVFDEVNICTNDSDDYLSGVDMANANGVLSREIENFRNRSVVKFSKNEDLFCADMFRSGEVSVDGENVTKKIKGNSVYNKSPYFKRLVKENPEMTKINQNVLAGNVGVVKAALHHNQQANIAEKNPGDKYHFNQAEKTCELTHVIKYSEKSTGNVTGKSIDLGEAELGELQYKGTFDYQKGIPLSGNISIQKPVERKFVFNPEVMKSLKRKNDELTSKSIKPISFKKKMFEDRNKKRIR